jgi:acyl-CoA thioester hydrolase
MISATTSIKVRYQETDKMGIVYHANYFTWLEVARVDLLERIDCPYAKLEECGYFLPVLSCSCEFKNPARFDDLLDIEVHIPKIKQVRIQANYFVRRGNEILATAKTTHAFVNQVGKVIRPPKIFLEQMVQCKQSLS